MKYTALFLLFITAILFSCNYGTRQQTTTTDSVKTTATNTPGPADSMILDSVVHDVNIEGKMYDIFILTNRYDSDHHLISADDPAIAALTVVLSLADSKQMVLKRKFTQNEFNLMKKGSVKLSENGRLYMSLIDIGGGSGFGATLYCVGSNAEGKLDFIPIMEYGELTQFAINSNDSDVFRLAGDWNFDEDESHFSEHRQKVFKYVLQEGKYVEMKLGETNYKYSGEEEMKDMVKEISEKEPQALEDIKLSDYSFDSK